MLSMPASLPTTDGLDSEAILAALDATGCFVKDAFICPRTCAELACLYDAGGGTFRSTVTMARHGFGQGEYRYFAYPLPGIVASLRAEIYRYLAPVANEWNRRLGQPADWPARHDGLLRRCAGAGQHRPTPLLLRYGPGDYNRLHQDLYGAVHFPMQAVLLLDRPAIDFEGGELVLVEQRARCQSTSIVVPVTQGALAVIPVRDRPVAGKRGAARLQVRHGVSRLRRGLRRTLGIIFHDAL